MTSLTLPNRGDINWDVALNAALTALNTGKIDVGAVAGGDLSGTLPSPTVTATHLSSPLPVAQGGTGAATASAALTALGGVAQGALVVSASDYAGLDPTGVSDSTTAIQNALAAVSSNGGKVYLPPGSYLLNGASGLSLATAATSLTGAGAEATKILIGAGFTGSAAVTISAYNCQVADLSISGANSTTASNPVADAIQITGVRRAKVNRVTFLNVNGWCIKAASTSSNGNSNAFGTQVSQVYGSACAGGVYFLGNSAQSYAMNCTVSDSQFYVGGVTTGGSANFDGVRVEDSWDVLLSNVVTWMSVGTGSALHVVGNSAATFVKNLDALGPTTGANVLIEDGPNGSVQNCQINGGVIQQGLTGLTISGGSNQVRVNTVRFINNQTHGIVVSGTGAGIYLNQLFFSTSGQVASGTIYDVNWSGSATGYITFCRFTSPIVASGTAGVQQSINVAAGQNVRVVAADFQGSGASSTNWFTNTPASVLEVSGGNFNFATSATFSGSTAVIAKGNIAAQPTASTNTVLSGNVNGSDGFDRFRLTGDGKLAIGPGTGSRDTSWGRQGTAQIGTADSDIVVGLAGKTLIVKSGTNAKAGTVVANGTTAVTVSTTAVTANSTIVLSYKSGTQGAGTAWVSTLTAGTSFQIKSVTGDTATYNWVILEQA